MSADATPTAPATLDWGRTGYVEALRAQEALVARRLAGEIGDTLVFTEHEPVFTVGLRAGASTHLVWSADRLVREGVEVVPTNRPGVLLLVLPVVRATSGRSLRPATGRRIKAGRNVEWVPMFILVRQVQMPRLLNWRGPAESLANRLPDQVMREWEARARVSE